MYNKSIIYQVVIFLYTVVLYVSKYIRIYQLNFDRSKKNSIGNFCIVSEKESNK